MTDQPDTLAVALAAFQANLPEITRNQSMEIPGRRTYRYADLATISKAVLPMLAEQGLSWTARPTQLSEGRFVLIYRLMHVGGESIKGVYPLPSPASESPQRLGSAITYARRYCLCAVVGVAAEDDDDGQAAAERAGSRARRPPAHDQSEREPDSVVDAVQTGARLTLAIRDAATLDELESHRLGITASLGAGRISDDKAAELVAALDARIAQLRTESDALPAKASDASTGPRVTRPQLNAIHTLYDECGWNDRADKLRATSTLIGRPVESTTDLTKQEAHRLIEVLQDAMRGDDPQVALTAIVEANTPASATGVSDESA